MQNVRTGIAKCSDGNYRRGPASRAMGALSARVIRKGLWLEETCAQDIRRECSKPRLEKGNHVGTWEIEF